MRHYHLVIFYTDPQEVSFLLSISSNDKVPSSCYVPIKAEDDAKAIRTARDVIDIETDVVHVAMLRTGSDPQANGCSDVAAWLNLIQPAGTRFITKNGEPDQLEEARDGVFFFRR
jgi:hypothetical protein